MDVRAMRLWIVLSSPQLCSAAEIVGLDEFGLEILGCFLQRAPGIALAFAYGSLAQTRSPGSEIVLETLSQIRRRAIKEKLSKFSVPSQIGFKSNVHQFMNVVALKPCAYLCLKISILLKKVLQKVCSVRHVDRGIDTSGWVISYLQEA